MRDVKILVLPHGKGLELPAYATEGSAGLDLRAAEGAVLQPGAHLLLPTGIAVALPAHFEGQVRPRSGLAMKHGVTVLNAPGTIDSDYRGEIKVIMVNLDPREPVRLAAGDRIAQLVIQRVEHATFHEVSELPGSDRGAAGYGSSGGFSHAALTSGPDPTSGGS